MPPENWWYLAGLLLATVGWVATGQDCRALRTSRRLLRQEMRRRKATDARAREAAAEHYAAIDRLRYAGLHADAAEMTATARAMGRERPARPRRLGRRR